MSTCEVHLYVHLIHLYVRFIYLHVHHTYMNICMMIRRVTGCKAGASTVISTGRGVMVGMLFVCVRIMHPMRQSLSWELGIKNK